jgi:beta-glucosidase-like glycosyl hydrolase
MSVLVSSLTNPHHTTYFSNNTTRRINENVSQTKLNRLTSNKLNNHDQNKDHVPYGVVSSMKQRLLNKVNESFLFNNTNNNNNNNNNNNSTLLRHSLSKPSSRLSSNENLLLTKTYISPLKHTTRLSRSQDNLTNDNNSINSILNPIEQFTSYIQPKQDVIIVDTTTNENDDNDGKLSAGQKTSTHRQSYTELHVDEAPKPGIFNTFK